MRSLARVLMVTTSMAAVVMSCSIDPEPAGAPASTTGTSTALPTETTNTETTNTETTTEPATTEPATTEPATTTTTPDPATLAEAYTTAGPYPVGVTTAALANGIQVEIWYPAVTGSFGTETYDVRDFTAPAIKAILTADIPATYSYPALRDAAVADGVFPVVLNSHGFSGIRVGSSFLTSHLASWGMIVVSPDHPTRDLYHAVAQITPEVVTEPADDLLQSLDLVATRGATTGDPFDGHVDTEHVGALGHSAGGGTVLRASLDQRIDGYVSMASGLFRDATASTELPNKPSFFLAGATDGVVDPTRTHDAFVAVPAPSLFWKIDGVGHNGFDDFCTFGNGTGIIGIAEASGLGPLLDAQPQFRALGQDGCVPPAAPVTSTFPIIDHAVTAFFRHLFGADAQALGLGVEVAGSFVQTVTIEER